jgi:proteasome accessory factor B
MSRRKTERLLSLVVCLLSTGRFLTADPDPAAVPGYPEQDAFKRMFERDKDELRELGIPLETGPNHPFDEEPGYRIRQQAYELPEIGWSRTRRPCSAWPPGSGGAPSWPARRRARC